MYPDGEVQVGIQMITVGVAKVTLSFNPTCARMRLAVADVAQSWNISEGLVRYCVPSA